MKLLVCAIYDNVSDRWLPPFCQQTKGQAIRGFMDEVNRAAEDNILYRHCDDFVLFRIGEFDDSSGHIDSILGSEEKLISGREAKAVVADPAQPRLKGVN